MMHPLRPIIYQGDKQKGDYFEGWYYKQSHQSYNGALAFIPGLSLGEDPHSFIQVIDGHKGKSWNERFDLNQFTFQNTPFEIKIGGNRFSLSHLEVDLPETSIKGRLEFTDSASYPWKPWSPGIMGPYAFAPYMECYHGVVSLDHGISGIIQMPDSVRDFTGGRGYIEKDWGRSFPESWIWMQGNLFDQPGISFMLSIARVPWRKNSFTGFLGFIYYDNKVFPFASYNGSRIVDINSNKKGLDLSIRRRSYELKVQLNHNGAAPLKAPAKGRMDRIIKESVESEISFRLNKGSKTLVEGKSSHCGSEICGNLETLL